MSFKDGFAANAGRILKNNTSIRKPTPASMTNQAAPKLKYAPSSFTPVTKKPEMSKYSEMKSNYEGFKGTNSQRFMSTEQVAYGGAPGGINSSVSRKVSYLLLVNS